MRQTSSLPHTRRFSGRRFIVDKFTDVNSTFTLLFRENESVGGKSIIEDNNV